MSLRDVNWCAATTRWNPLAPFFVIVNTPGLAGGTIGGLSAGLAEVDAEATLAGSAAKLPPARTQSPAIPKTIPILFFIPCRLFFFLKASLKIKTDTHSPHDPRDNNTPRHKSPKG